MDSKQRVLRTVTQLCDEHKAFTPGSIRWLLFNGKTNGLEASGAVVRIGRRVLINVDQFFAWIDGQQCVTSVARGSDHQIKPTDKASLGKQCGDGQP